VIALRKERGLFIEVAAHDAHVPGCPRRRRGREALTGAAVAARLSAAHYNTIAAGADPRTPCDTAHCSHHILRPAAPKGDATADRNHQSWIPVERGGFKKRLLGIMVAFGNSKLSWATIAKRYPWM